MTRPTSVAGMFFVVLIILLSLGLHTTVNAEYSPLEETALAYARNLLPFDINHYNLTVREPHYARSEPGSPKICATVSVNMSSSDSSLWVTSNFLDNNVYQFSVSVISGVPVCDRSYGGSLKETAASILEREQDLTGICSTDLIYCLNFLDETKNMEITLGNVTAGVDHHTIPTGNAQMINNYMVFNYSTTIDSTTFRWYYTVNGASYYYISIRFDNGVFHDLFDERAVYPVGDIAVNFAKQEAVDKALDYLTNYTSKFNLNVVNVSANLQSNVRNYTALYPSWSLLVYFNQTNVDEVNIKLWADNGEVFECYQGGAPLNMDELRTHPTPIPSPTQSPQPTTTQAPTTNPTPENNNQNSELSSLSQTSTPSAKEISKQNFQVICISTAALAITTTIISVAIYKRKRIMLSTPN